MNLMNNPPMGQRAPKAGKDPVYLKGVAQLPCCICEAYGEVKLSRTTVHHTICGRYGTHKTPDRQAIPLCGGHHQGDLDTSKTAIHRDREEWVRKYGKDTDYIARTQDAVAGEINT